MVALEQSVKSAPADDAALRSAIVNVTNYYLRLAEGKTPAEVEAIIWQHDSIDGVDHGASCAAFASLTLELAAQVVGQQSWVTGGSSYPWPLHKWADVRVDPNPASLGVVSIRQDAAAHNRWHPLGDGYQPLPGDWVLFNGHVEVVTKYAGGVLHSVGGDSLPNFSINAHEYRDPLGAQGVVGFVNNGALPGTVNKKPPSRAQAPGGHQARGKTARKTAPKAAGQTARKAAGQAAGKAAGQSAGNDAPGLSAIPGAPAAAAAEPTPARPRDGAAIPGMPVPAAGRAGPAAATPQAAAPGAAAIPGMPVTAQHPAAGPSAPAAAPRRTDQPAPATTPADDASAQQAFIREVAPGAVAAQRRYGIPAAVTIAQAINESGWGRSKLATRDHNLFGIKGTGPAGRDPQPTREYENGQWVTHTAIFRVYHDVAESIDDHSRLLATSGYYKQAMANRQDPDAFAAALTGVYATDPDYGAKLTGLMRQHDLYRYDIVPSATTPPAATPPVATPPAATQGGAAIPGLPPADPAPPTTTRTASRKVYAHTRKSKYQQHIPPSIMTSFITTARVPLLRGKPLYQDVADHSGIHWELLAACDWMQCGAQLRYSPVHGEKLGTVNPDGTIYRTKSEALAQCADDLVQLSWTVYRIDLTAGGHLSVRDLANVFAAFRWGGLLKLHHTSAMEFPYSVAGLTAQHINMRWPNIAEPNTPDKPGGRFRMPFGATPIVLGLDYPATV